MRKLILILEILLLIVIVVFALVFLTKNQIPVQLDMLAFKTGTLDLGMLVVFVFMLGAIIGLLVRIPDALWRAMASKLSSSSKDQSKSGAGDHANSSSTAATGSSLTKGRAKAS